MLDAYIIERIRRDREQGERERERLRLPLPEMPAPFEPPLEQRPDGTSPTRPPGDDREGGVVIVDFTI